MIVDPDQLPAMAENIAEAVRNGERIGPAIEPFVRLESFPSKLRPAKKFLMVLDKTIFIPPNGTECYYDVRQDKVVMCDPGLLPLDTWFSVALHECLHWTESVLEWYGTPDQWELRSEIGQEIFNHLLGLDVVRSDGNYDKWTGHWLRGIDRNDGYIFDTVSSAIAGVEFLIQRAAELRTLLPRRQYINDCFEQLIDYVRQEQLAESNRVGAGGCAS